LGNAGNAGNTASRRCLLYALYALLPIGAAVAVWVHRTAGTLIVVAAVIGLVLVSVAAKDHEP
jgi:hypothetical protein